jgi:hypothetical protein
VQTGGRDRGEENTLVLGLGGGGGPGGGVASEGRRIGSPTGSLGTPKRGQNATAFRLQKELLGGSLVPRVPSVEPILRGSIRLSRRRSKEPPHNRERQNISTQPGLQNGSINRRRDRIVIRQSVARESRRVTPT